MGKSGDAPHDVHNKVVGWVKRRIRNIGYEVRAPNGRSNSCCCCDLLVSHNGNRPLRVAIKAVTMRRYTNRQINGNGSTRKYHYRAARTNLHDCRLSRRASAEVAVICVLEDDRIVVSYVLPWRELRRRRSVFIQPAETVSGTKWYDQYEETWSLLG